MALITKNDIPLYATTTKFLVPATTIGDESDYTAFTSAGNGNWVLGSLLKARRVLITMVTGAAANSPTGVKFGLAEGTDANGSSAAFITDGSATYTTALDNNVRELEVSLAGIDEAKYYSPAISVKGGGTATLLAAASARFLEPTHVA